jgi:hypothetical protein
MDRPQARQVGAREAGYHPDAPASDIDHQKVRSAIERPANFPKTLVIF